MEEKKGKLSTATIVVIFVSVVAIVFALVGLAIFLILIANKEKENGRYDSYITDYYNTFDTEKNNTNTKISNTSASNETEEKNNENNNVSSNGKESSLESLLSVGEWGTASKYSSSDKKDKELNVKITNIRRGENIENEVKNWFNTSGTIYKYPELKEGMEWAVIDYTVDFSEFGESSTMKVNSEIAGLDGHSIKYDNKIYVVSTVDMSGKDSVESGIASGRFCTQLPIGCKDYIIIMGNDDSTRAYFKGK